MKVSEKYKEIFKLKKMLEDTKIPFDFFSLQDDVEPKIKEVVPGFEHWHITYPSGKNFIISAIEGFGSYGENADKIEIMEMIPGEEEGSVQGWLTAEEVFLKIKNDYTRRFKNEESC